MTTWLSTTYEPEYEEVTDCPRLKIEIDDQRRPVFIIGSAIRRDRELPRPGEIIARVDEPINLPADSYMRALALVVLNGDYPTETVFELRPDRTIRFYNGGTT